MNNNKFRFFISVIIVSFILFLGMSMLPRPSEPTHNNDDESIVVELLSFDSAVVTYYHHNTQDELYVEVEYPEEGMTDGEQLDALIVEAIATLKDIQ